MDQNKIIHYNDELWASVEDNIVTIGVKPEALEDASEIWGVDLPEEAGEVNPEEICGEVETDEGPINLYSPIEGEVLEINTAVVTDPEMLLEDSDVEGWLVKIESTNSEDLDSFLAENRDEDEEDSD